MQSQSECLMLALVPVAISRRLHDVLSSMAGHVETVKAMGSRVVDEAMLNTPT